MAKLRLLVVVACAGLGGGVAAAMVVPTSAVAATCELNVCSTSSGDCGMSDLHLSCRETSGGCATTGCFPTQT